MSDYYKNKMEKLIRGLQIFQRYDEPMAHAEHDVLYGGCAGEVSEADQAKLERLGWHRDDEGDGWLFFT